MNRPPRPPRPSRDTRSGDVFLYSGNRHETVPRTLLLDRRLTPLERNAWQVFRLLFNDADASASFPSYEAIQPFLSSLPSGQASRQTIARVLTVLRLTRWVSLMERRRDADKGFVLGNLYMLHDEPISPAEAMELDDEYMELVGDCLTHPSKAVQTVATHALKEIDAGTNLREVPTRLNVMMKRTERARKAKTGGPEQSYPQGRLLSELELSEIPLSSDSELSGFGLSSELELSEKSLSSELELSAQGLSSKLELSEKPAENHRVPIRAAGGLSTSTSTDIYKSSTSTGPGTGQSRSGTISALPLRVPDRFRRLEAQQQTGVMVALQQVDVSLRQAVLDEWEARCASTHVRNPAGYLFGIVQKAIRGQFKVWESKQAPAPSPASPPTSPARSPVDASAPHPAVQAAMAQENRDRQSQVRKVLGELTEQTRIDEARPYPRRDLPTGRRRQ
jgi:hypothetical protein